MRKNKAWLLFLGHKIRPEPDYIKVKPYPIANVLSRSTDDIKHKKRGTAAPLNLKSNTMKNTLQR